MQYFFKHLIYILSYCLFMSINNVVSFHVLKLLLWAYRCGLPFSGSKSKCDPTNEVACKNHPSICVDLERIRDGFDDCPDASDEGNKSVIIFIIFKFKGFEFSEGISLHKSANSERRWVPPSLNVVHSCVTGAVWVTIVPLSTCPAAKKMTTFTWMAKRSR